MRRSSRLSALATVLLLSLGGCGGCKKSEPLEGPGLFFPAEPSAYLSVPNPLAVMERLGRLESSELANLVAPLAGLEAASDLVRPVERQLGFHPLRPASLAEIGLSAERELAAGSDEDERWLLALPVADAAKAGRWLEGLAERKGGPTRTERSWEGAGQRVVAFLGKDGEVRLAYALKGGYALVSEGKDAVEAVGRALARPRENSLQDGSLLRRTKARLGAERDLIAWYPQEDAKGKARRIAVGLRAREALDLRLLIDAGFWEMSVLEALGKRSGAELLPLLSADDFLLMRFGADPAALEPVLGLLFRSSLRQLRAAGVDPASDLLLQLHPGVVVGVDLEPEPDLSAGLPSPMGLARSATNPFHFVRASFVARVKDPARAKQSLEKIAEAAEKLQIEVEKQEEGELTAYGIRYKAGEGLRLGLVGDRLVAAGGTGSFERLVKRLQGKADALGARDPAAWAAFEQGASGVYLDVPLLSRKLREIPESAFGIGGFRLKALLERWAGILGELKGMSVALGADGEGLIVDAVIGLKES